MAADKHFKRKVRERGSPAGLRQARRRPTWAVREYFVGRDDSHFVLGCGSSVPDEDDALFTQIAERFEFLGSLGS